MSDAYLVENWDTETLVHYLQEQGLKLDDEDFATGLEMGPAMRLAKESKAYRTQVDVKEVLAKYKLGDSISSIPQFEPAIHKLEDTNEMLMQ